MSSNDIQTPTNPKAPGNLKIKALVVVIVAIILVAFGILSRANNQKS